MYFTLPPCLSAAGEQVDRRQQSVEQRDGRDEDCDLGRKLDFVVQELNREANTIGSKAQDASIAHMVIEMKAEIEKIREQIQNLE